MMCVVLSYGAARTKVKVSEILYKQQITEILLRPLYPWIDAHEESKSQQSLIRHPHTTIP